MSYDQTIHTRTTYNLLDYLRDIGGLFGALNAIFGAIVFVLNFDGLYQLLTSTLFRVQTLDQASQNMRLQRMRGKNQLQRSLSLSLAKKVTGTIDSKVGISSYSSVNFSFFSTMILNIKRFTPACCRVLCCKETTKDRMFKRGYQKFRKEIDIVNVLKQLRILKSLSKQNFSRI